MERIQNLNSSLTVADNAGFTKEELRTGIRKRVGQATEDLSKVMKEWKSKGSVNSQELVRFLLGDMYKHHKAFLDYFASDLTSIFFDYQTKSKDEMRFLTNSVLYKTAKKFPVSMETYLNDPWLLTSLIMSMASCFSEVAAKLTIHFFLYTKTIYTLGTETHLDYVHRALRLEDVGCFALTEISHGSNVQGMLTTAVYDEDEKCFFLHTPNERAAKFWIGGAGQSANMAIVGANLIVKDKNYGIHMFVVQIRDHKTHDLLPGITIADCGDKQGLNGIDNGMILFRYIKIPLRSLLNKITQVSEAGEVTSLFERKTKRFAVQLGGLSDGRLKLLNICTLAGIKGAAITLRYATVRRQFGEHQNFEHNLLSYPQYQNRIFPYLASFYLFHFANRMANLLWFDNYQRVLDPKNKEVKEMHAIISILKPIVTWTYNDSINEYRQAMGGFGFLAISQIAGLLNDGHVNMTWEGDNYVLLHQTARFVLKGFAKFAASDKPSKYKSLSYFTKAKPAEYFNRPIDEKSLRCPMLLKKLMAYRASLAAEAAGTFLQQRMGETEPFLAWNDSIPFHITNAALYYGENLIYNQALEGIMAAPSKGTQEFLFHLLTIYALNKIKSSWTTMSSALNSAHLEAINLVLLQEYQAIKYDAVRSLDDFFNDEFINSPFGCEDGNMYDRLLSKINGDRSNFGKAGNWRENWNNRRAY